ncbi:uncharacterized protein WCC33_001078 [Rhinophrynus dorsalis]
MILPLPVEAVCEIDIKSSSTFSSINKPYNNPKDNSKPHSHVSGIAEEGIAVKPPVASDIPIMHVQGREMQQIIKYLKISVSDHGKEQHIGYAALPYIDEFQYYWFTIISQTHCFKSHSHLMSLSLLLLLAAGDISPNPGPPSILSWTTEPTHTRNTHNLITVPRHLTSSPPFCFGLWNARSVCNKLTAVHDLFISHSLNLLAITETWLTSSDTASTAALSYGGLQFTHTPRPGNRQGGGVGILLPPNHIFQVLPTVPSLSFPTFETHTLRLFSPLPLRVAVIYRPPGPTAQFLDHFTSWLPHFMSSDVPTLIMGDFNIPIDNHNTPPALKLLSLTTSLGLSQSIESYGQGHILRAAENKFSKSGLRINHNIIDNNNIDTLHHC